jgi:transposase-like protein
MDDMNLIQLVKQFHDDDEACRSYLEGLRWPNGAICPRCKADKIYRILKRDQFVCDSCSYQFSVTAGTIFHDSHLPLWKWIVAIYLMVESKKGMSANQLKRTLKVSYKTAWYLCHRIRAAMTEVNPRPLRGTVELDETYIGGKRKWRARTYLRNKTMVLGALERGGPVRLRVEKRSKSASQKIVRQFIQETTAPDTEKLYTDGHPAYFGIQDHDTKHESVDHVAEEWVRGDVHTNGIESAWSLFKRSIVGSYHQVSAKHLDAYLDEFEWRFNNRKNPFLFRDTVCKLIGSDNVSYEQLVKKSA